jgi:hypothetical protein
MILLGFLCGFLACPLLAEAALTNPGFEDDFDGWTTGGLASTPGQANIPTTWPPGTDTVPFSKHEGEKMAALAYSGGLQGGLVWDNFIYQDIALGPDDNYLNFVYRFWTYDEGPFDNPGFLMEINGKTIYSVKAADVGDGTVGTLNYTTGQLNDGWTGISVPIGQYYSPGRPVSLRISFLAGNSGDDQYPSGVFIDAPNDFDEANGVEGPLSLNPPPSGSGFVVIPIPPAILLLGSGLLGLICFRRKAATKA